MTAEWNPWTPESFARLVAAVATLREQLEARGFDNDPTTIETAARDHDRLAAARQLEALGHILLRRQPPWEAFNAVVAAIDALEPMPDHIAPDGALVVAGAKVPRRVHQVD